MSSQVPQAPPHVPVMSAECLEWLAAAPGKTVIDGTFGAGGHSRLLLEAGCRVIAIDQDPRAASTAEEFLNEFGPERFAFHAANFRSLDSFLPAAGADAALFDLGVSSMQLDEGERGFAFRQDGPLNMRMSKEGESAAEVIENLSEADLAAVIYRLGEERHSRRIARGIKAAQAEAAITTTGRLAEVILSAYPGGRRRDHPARRTFQALRLHVNDELGALQDVLDGAATVLAPGGRLVVMSYHSLEDRIVKHTLQADARWTVLTRKPVTAGDDEVEVNPRARSAKLRAAERVAA